MTLTLGMSEHNETDQNDINDLSKWCLFFSVNGGGLAKHIYHSFFNFPYLGEELAIGCFCLTSFSLSMFEGISK